MIKVKGINFYPKQVESVLLRHAEVGNDYRIVIDRLEGADRMTIDVEARGLPWPEELSRQLSDELFSMLGLRAEVSILHPGELPRPEGKAVRVQDRRK